MTVTSRLQRDFCSSLWQTPKDCGREEFRPGNPALLLSPDVTCPCIQSTQAQGHPHSLCMLCSGLSAPTWPLPWVPILEYHGKKSQELTQNSLYTGPSRASSWEFRNGREGALEDSCTISTPQTCRLGCSLQKLTTFLPGSPKREWELQGGGNRPAKGSRCWF